MTRASQPPISNLPAATPATPATPEGPAGPPGPPGLPGPSPRPGSSVFSTGPGPGLPAGLPAPRRSRRRVLLAVTIAAVVVVAVIVAGLVVASHPKGKLVLPARLLGLPKATSASARHLADQLKTAEESGTGGKLADVVVGVYGSPTSAWFAVTGGGICGTCSANSASTQRHDLAAAGYSDATSFPAGPKGGVLTCGSRTSQGSTVLRCTWVDGQTAGNMLLAAGAASSLADAAAKTNQVRAATEH